MKRLIVGLLFLILSACGNPTDKKSFGPPSDNSNNVDQDVGIDETDSGDETPTCGNGSVDPGETCDGNCPATCDDDNACTVDIADGDATSCSLVCENVPVGCNNDDGCCPPQCTFDIDNDCSATCGDGVIDDGETCDGDCPTDCSVADACFVGSISGSVNNCTAQCMTEEITGCINSDGCCPTGCNQATDNDCSADCGNGVIEDGESCDGDCPVSCNDNVACTRDAVSGSANTCDVMCSNTPITACQNSDGCCPNNCTWMNDNDCSCSPMSCGQQGLECGQATNGCGANINCGGCANGESCFNNQCVPTGSAGIGDPCVDGTDCTSGVCATEANDFRDGYCTDDCRFNSDCPSGSHCGLKDQNGDGFCLDTCTSDVQCRADGYLCYDVENDNASECFPAGTGAGGVGAPCNGSWDCGGDEAGWCIFGWPGGYCTQSCSPLTFDLCPSGASCGIQGFDTTGICHDSCVTNADCRAGYTCEQLLNIAGNGCVGPT